MERIYLGRLIILKVKDLMSTDVSTADINTPVADIAKTMKERNVGSVPVCQNGKVVGIITDRDIVLREIAMGKDTNVSKAVDVMTKGIASVNSNTDIHDAAKLMSEKQIRRLPVIDNGNLVGMLAIGDIAVVNKLEDNAGVALSDISENSHTSY
jgi:CBS domain-containing protein